MIAVESTRTVFRLATLADRLAVNLAFRAYLQAVGNFGHDVLPTIENVALYWAEVFAPAMRDGRSCLVLAEQDDAIIGALFWFLPEQCVGFRYRFAWDYGAWVAPGHRRNGIATSMRTFALDLLRDQGVQSVVSTILKGNVAGIESYKKVGGKIIGYMVEIPIAKGDA